MVTSPSGRPEEKESSATEAVRQERMDATMLRSALKVVDPKDALCPADSCLYKVDDRSLYFDDSHLSVYGALYVAPMLEPCFAVD